MSKLHPEFVSQEQQDAYVAGLLRELEGTRVRGQDDYAENVLAELKRFGVKDPDAKPEKPAAVVAAPAPESDPEPSRPQPRPKPRRTSK